MSKSDQYGIDGYTLKVFLSVLEEGAVTKAAGRMGVTQSAVSHTLDRLRSIFDDPCLSGMDEESHLHRKRSLSESLSKKF